MCLPLLAFLLVMTMFFGWAMMNQQNVKAASRYVAWENAYSLAFSGNGQDANHVEDWTDANSATLNGMFFRGEATSASVVHHGATDDEYDQWISDAYGKSTYAGDFANALILNPPPGYAHFNHTAGDDIWATFSNNVEAFRQFSGDIHGVHVRGGTEWRKSEAECSNVTRIQFLQSLETQLNAIPAPGASMAEMIKGTYHNGW